MSVATVSSSGVYAYLQSLLQQQSSADGAGAGDPIASLLEAFYPNGIGSTPGSAPSSNDTTASANAVSPLTGVQFSPDTLGTLISLQGQRGWTDRVTNKAQSMLTQFDSDGDGSISKSEFENGFGSNADMSKVDTLFSKLDTNGDGSISQTELVSAARQSRAHHHHHHIANSGSPGGADPLALLTSAPQGTSTTTTNTDGSTTTTITYADGSTVTMNIPAASSSSQTASDGTGSQSTGYNVLQQLIQLQAQLLAQSANALTASISAI
jgi:EF-hand domain pair